MADHVSCKICQNIPNISTEVLVRGELEDEGLPSAAEKLEIVGAPFFNDDLMGSKTLLKICPLCGTFYEWKYEYEFLVTGSEDDIWLTRLDDAEGQRRREEVLATIQAAFDRFHSQAENALQVLALSENAMQLKEALSIFSYAQLVQGFDTAFAIPALIRSLARLLGRDEYAPVSQEIITMLGLISQSAENAKLILAEIDRANPSHPEFEKLRSWCARI